MFIEMLNNEDEKLKKNVLYCDCFYYKLNSRITNISTSYLYKVKKRDRRKKNVKIKMINEWIHCAIN